MLELAPELEAREVEVGEIGLVGAGTGGVGLHPLERLGQLVGTTADDGDGFLRHRMNGERQGRDGAREDVRQAHQRAPSVTLAAVRP